MKKLVEYKNEIHSCSKCGLCQSVCPIYKATGNDCTVSRGIFIMLKGLINGELKMSKKLNRYLDLCLKCDACSKFCPSCIDVVDIIASAKAEYFQTSLIEKATSCIQKLFIYILKFLSALCQHKNSNTFDKKVVYFEGCGEAFRGNSAVIKLLNKCNIEVISPKFKCCGIPYFVRGDFKTFEQHKKYNLELLKQYENIEVVTTCASCEKTLKKAGINAKNIFVYLKEYNVKLKLKEMQTVTFHKPCNLENLDDVEWILNNTENLKYIKMKGFDKCCGLNGLSKPCEYKTMFKIFDEKHKNIVATGAKTVLTSCPGCETTLILNSHFKYKTKDLTSFLATQVK